MANYYYNTMVGKHLIEAYDMSDVLNFHKSIQSFSDFKMIDIKPNVTIIDCSESLGLNSFKVFGVTYAFYKMMQKKFPEICDYTSLIKNASSCGVKVCTASDGNFGVAVSHLCSKLKLECQVYLPIDTPQFYVDKLKNANAEIKFIDGDYDKCIDKVLKNTVNDRCEVLLDTSISGIYENEFVENIMRGYLSVFSLIDKKYDYVFIPVGVGGLLSAAITYFKSNNYVQPVIISVEPEKYNCVQESLKKKSRVSVFGGKTVINGLMCGTVSALAWNNIKLGTDIAMTLSDEEAEKGYNELKSLGVRTGYTGATAYSGYLMFIDKYYIDSNKKILIINSERSGV